MNSSAPGINTSAAGSPPAAAGCHLTCRQAEGRVTGDAAVAAPIAPFWDGMTAAILDAIPIPVTIIDDAGVVFGSNRAWIDLSRRSGASGADNLTGALPAGGQGAGVNRIAAWIRAGGAADHETARIEAGIHAVLNGEREGFSLECRCSTCLPAGTTVQQDHYYIMTVSPCRHDGRRGAVISCIDISESRRAENNARDLQRQNEAQLRQQAAEMRRKEARIAELAHTDPLTGLPNRTLAANRLAAALSKAGHSRQQVAVLCIDLDNFRAINDSKDHAAGDSLLTLAARRLSSAIRQNDTVSRIGGDEFLVVSPVPRQAFASALAERLLATLDRPFNIDSLDFFITASIGIAMFPADGTTPDQLLKNAEIAMYQAKHAGRNCFRRYERGQNERLVRQVAIERDLHAALRKRSFPVHYQPIVAPARGEIVGMEALVRWRQPDDSLVPPDRFIPVAEETGLIRELGYQVLEQACCDTMAFHAAGYPQLRVSVNISAVQFQDRELAPMVLRILQKTGLHAACLNLEITETTLMADLAATELNLRRLASHGITFSIDDFGTGYSSLYYLKRFPIRSIKIDRSFIRDIILGGDDAAIVSAILHMATLLNLETVAEGVENPEQLAFLLRRGINLVQGYHYSPPVPHDQFRGLLSRNYPPYRCAGNVE